MVLNTLRLLYCSCTLVIFPWKMAGSSIPLLFFSCQLIVYSVSFLYDEHETMLFTVCQHFNALFLHFLQSYRGQSPTSFGIGENILLILMPINFSMSLIQTLPHLLKSPMLFQSQKLLLFLLIHFKLMMHYIVDRLI